MRGMRKTSGTEDRETNLTRTRWSSRRRRSTSRHTSPGRAVGSSWHSMRMTISLARPVSIALWRVARVLRHVMTLRSVRGVRAGIGGTRGGDGGIYRYVGVRLDVWSVMMVMVMPILQRHGRTCSLRHTC